MLKIGIYIFISEHVCILLLLQKRQSSDGASPELWVLIYTCVGCARLSPCTRVGVFVHQACICVLFQSSFSAMRSSLLRLTVSLPSLSIPFCVKTVNIQELAPLEMPSFTLSLFLSSCLRTLPIWNPACDSSTRRGKRLSRLRALCPQSPPPLSGPGGLRLRHGPQGEAVPNLLEAGDVLCMKLSLLPLASAPTQGELFLVDSLTAWLQYPLAPPFGRGQSAPRALVIPLVICVFYRK